MLLKKILFAALTDPSHWDSCSPNQCLRSNCSTGSSCKSIAFITILLQISPRWVPLLFRVQREIFLSQSLLQIDPQLQAHIEALIKQWRNCLKTRASFFFSHLLLFIIHERLSKRQWLRKNTHFGPNRICNVRIYISAERQRVLYDQATHPRDIPPLFWRSFYFNLSFKVLH